LEVVVGEVAAALGIETQGKTAGGSGKIPESRQTWDLLVQTSSMIGGRPVSSNPLLLPTDPDHPLGEGNFP